MSEWWWGLRRRTRDCVAATTSLVLGLLLSLAFLAMAGLTVNWGGLVLGVTVGWVVSLAIGKAAGWWFQ